MIKIKLAIISDIHGNIEALDCILEELNKEEIDKIVVLGDICNELPNGNEVIERLKQINAFVLKGNKEEYFLDYEKYKYNWENIQFKNTIFMCNQLSEENKEFIRKLPFQLIFNIENVRIKCVHGSPESTYELLYEHEEEKLDKYTKSLEEDILVFGHIHDPIWVKQINGKTVINAGCAGASVFNIGQAEYVILDIKNGKYNIESRKVTYSLEKLKENIIKSGMAQNERTFINLVYLSLIGKKEIRKSFFREGIEKMITSNRKLYKEDAKGIFKTFKMLDDDIWIEQTEKVKDLFLL